MDRRSLDCSKRVTFKINFRVFFFYKNSPNSHKLNAPKIAESVNDIWRCEMIYGDENSEPRNYRVTSFHCHLQIRGKVREAWF